MVAGKSVNTEMELRCVPACSLEFVAKQPQLVNQLIHRKTIHSHLLRIFRGQEPLDLGDSL